MCFGEESSFLVFLQCYFSLTIVHKLLIEEDASQMLNIARQDGHAQRLQR
jgi:hypothetical protein